MDWKYASVVFGSILIAELGDKTQLATLLFATDKNANPIVIFAAASLALILTSALGVFAGGILGHFINEKYLAWAAGAGFILIGLYTFWKG